MPIFIFHDALHHPSENPALGFDRDISLILTRRSWTSTSFLSASITRVVGRPCPRRKWRLPRPPRTPIAFVSARR